MPRGDKTGPEGIGPITGRKLGFCVGNENPGFYYDGLMNQFGNSRGRFHRKYSHKSFFQRRRFWTESHHEQLGDQNQIKEEIALLQKRINQLESKLK